jgi:phosphoribosylglycinamide formyltransferase-1
MPIEIIEAFPMRMINLHPALLPKFGGKGMYGIKVHQAVVDAREKETGISIHYVNAHYDEGDIIFQAKTNVEKEDSANRIAEKIHLLEQEYLPKVTEELIAKI